MQFVADLDIAVDGSAAHVRGDGATLIVETDRPAPFLVALRRAAGPGSRQHLSRFADRLAENGATVHIDGPRGRVLTVGAGVGSWALRPLSGTRHVATGSIGAVTAAAVGDIRARWVALLAGGVAATTLSATLLTRRRRRPGR